ncbi:MAG TPA: alpha/beta hydrolase [Candidatus Dormibacteraeota bacterium]|nr:alpha/beta hydrolase [Candidatus Dormibacteraeota bacterium]
MSARRAFARDGTRLSYVDFGGDGAVLVALHGHRGCARNFAPLAEALAPDWRVLALDQRGHGWSHRPRACDRPAYVGDAEAFLLHLGAGPVPVLGHSLGGVNAYQLAARRPDLVSTLIIEDAPARVGPPPPEGPDWPRRFQSLGAVLHFLQEHSPGLGRHVLDSLVELEDGWAFRFEPAWLARSREALAGDWSADWRSSSCPALLVHGTRSHVLSQEGAREMAAERPHTRLFELDAGHSVHDDRPADFAAAVGGFLAEVAPPAGAARLPPLPAAGRSAGRGLRWPS